MVKPDIYNGYEPLFPNLEKDMAFMDKLAIARKLCESEDYEHAIKVLFQAVEIDDKKKDIPLFVIANCYSLMDKPINACHYYRLAYDALYAKAYDQPESWLTEKAENV